MKSILLIFMSILPCIVMASTRDDYIAQLDNLIGESKKYDRAKEKSIATLRQNYENAVGAQRKWQTCKALFDAYSSYQYDSAYVYAVKGIQLAHALDNPSSIVISNCDKIFSLLSAGLYKEASDEIEGLKIDGAGPDAKRLYYYTRWRFYADLADYARVQPYLNMYTAKAHVMADSVKVYLKKGSWQYDYITALQFIKEGVYEQSKPIFIRLLKVKGIGLHDKAIIASNLGWIYRLSKTSKNEDTALSYFLLSACYDIQNSTKETTAAREAGSMLYDMGDYTHAITYVQHALDDAHFFGARQRIIEINNILPIIQRDRYESVAKQRNTMVVATIIISLFFIALCISLFFLRRKVKELQRARQTISERNKQLETSNRALLESNKIKTEYIGRTFTINADYINLMEKLFRTLDRKIRARQYDDLSRSLQESKLNAQRKSMYADFDDAFLSIFPDFIEKYNNLFAPENRKEPDKKQRLTTEMRIFALIRLGVTDSDRIASFLNYSVNTINTYKTRVKNKSIVSNEEFEEKIMAIDA